MDLHYVFTLFAHSNFTENVSGTCFHFFWCHLHLVCAFRLTIPLDVVASDWQARGLLADTAVSASLLSSLYSINGWRYVIYGKWISWRSQRRRGTTTYS